jgi:MerR family transcriptional regulator, light-induced transcriptional regulator
MQEGEYRSGAAARMSGVNVATLRIWERRYSVVGPKTSAGKQRLYSYADIKRLSLIKQLVDNGHPIGSIASLSAINLAELLVMARPHANQGIAIDTPPTTPTLRIALVGPFLASGVNAKSLASQGLQIVGRSANLELAVSELEKVTADLVFVETSTLADGDLQLLAAVKLACGAGQLVVMYRYAPNVLIRQLRVAGHRVVRASANAEEMRDLCLRLVQPSNSDEMSRSFELDRLEPNKPIFNEHTLAQFSAQSQTVECECPKHLAELVMNLTSFERYSAQCSNRNPADALLHRKLERAAGLARSVLEDALEAVAIAEGFVLPRPENV